MRLALLLLALIAGVLFCLTTLNLVQEWRREKAVFPSLTGDLKGFETSTEIPGLRELKALYVSKIKENNAIAESRRRTWIWISFAVTALTAASTLVSSIKAAKGDGANTQRFLILIAVFTFFASLGNWTAGQVSETRNQALQTVSKLSEQRISFYSAFQRAGDDTEKEAVVQQYRDELEGL